MAHKILIQSFSFFILFNMSWCNISEIISIYVAKRAHVLNYFIGTYTRNCFNQIHISIFILIIITDTNFRTHHLFERSTVSLNFKLNIFASRTAHVSRIFAILSYALRIFLWSIITFTSKYSVILIKIFKNFWI